MCVLFCQHCSGGVCVRTYPVAGLCCLSFPATPPRDQPTWACALSSAHTHLTTNPTPIPSRICASPHPARIVCVFSCLFIIYGHNRQYLGVLWTGIEINNAVGQMVFVCSNRDYPFSSDIGLLVALELAARPPPTHNKNDNTCERITPCALVLVATEPPAG